MASAARFCILGGSDILFMRGQRPLVSERVGQFAVAIPPKHVGDEHIGAGAGSHSLFERRVHVVYIKKNALH